MKNFECWEGKSGLCSLSVGPLKVLKQKAMSEVFWFSLEEISEAEIKGFRGEAEGKELTLTHTYQVLILPCPTQSSQEPWTRKDEPRLPDKGPGLGG